MDQLVCLAIEIFTLQTTAMDAARERVKVVHGSYRYSRKEWAADVLRLLPEDRDDARTILRYHTPGETTPQGDRRRTGQLVGQYYRRLERRPDLIKAGERIWRLVA